MAKADLPKKKKTEHYLYGAGSAGVGAGYLASHRLSLNYIPKGTSLISYQSDVPLINRDIVRSQKGGKYVHSINKRRGWSIGGKTHKSIKTIIKSPMTRNVIEQGTKQFGERTTTWHSSIKGGKAARLQKGLGKDRFGISIFESNIRKGKHYKIKSVMFDPLQKGRDLFKVKKGYSSLFPQVSKSLSSSTYGQHIVNVMTPSGEVRGLISESSKIGKKIASSSTGSLTKTAITAGKFAGKAFSGVGTAWALYDATAWSAQWHKDNPGATLKKYKETYNK